MKKLLVIPIIGLALGASGCWDASDARDACRDHKGVQSATDNGWGNLDNPIVICKDGHVEDIDQ